MAFVFRTTAICTPLVLFPNDELHNDSGSNCIIKKSLAPYKH